MANNDMWYKVDNVAKVFLATYNRRDTRSFRVSCTLNEKVDPEILQEAVTQTAREQTQFQVIIHKGLFWHYMEVTDKMPVVEKENDRPCPMLYGPAVEGQLHYKVSYFENRINVDMFHALTDGNGGLQFLNVIVQNYLKKLYPDNLKKVSMYSGATAEDLRENSFAHFYGLGGKTGDKPKKSYQIQGLKLPYDQLQFFETHMSASKNLKLAKELGVSLTSYLGARLMMAIYKNMSPAQRKKPVTISMPVNLRNYYPSETSRNFFNSVYVSHLFTGGETLENLSKEFDRSLKEALTPEKIAAQMDNYQKLERLIFIKLVPLFIKNPVVAFFANREKKSVSAVISNLGRVQIPDELKPYIKGYAACCSSETVFITVSSYEDDLTFGIASPYRNTSVLKRFIGGFTKSGIDVTVYATETV